MPKIYLHMARRDKSAVKILCIFKGEAIQPTRINNIKDLNFPSSLETRISNVFHPNRLLWEVWLESASDTAELRKNIMKTNTFSFLKKLYIESKMRVIRRL